MDELTRSGAEPGLRLIETLGWDGVRPLREERHLARMARSAAVLGWRFDEGAARAAGDRSELHSFPGDHFAPITVGTPAWALCTDAIAGLLAG